MTELKGKRFLLFGSEGYLGRHMAHFFTQQGALIVPFDIHPESKSRQQGYKQIDLTQPEMLKDIDWNVDGVFMFSGLTGTADSFTNYEKFQAVNEGGLLNLLSAVKQSEYRPRIIFPSTRLVYKGAAGALAEDAEKEAKTIYASNKLACENLLFAWQNAFDIPYTVFRLCVPYGNMLSGEYSYGTMGFFMRSARTSGTIPLYGDGAQRRTFSHVEDICRQIAAACLMDETRNEVYNIHGEDFSLAEVATMIATRTRATLKFTEWPEMALRLESGDTVFDAQKLLQITHYSLMHSLEEWIDGSLKQV